MPPPPGPVPPVDIISKLTPKCVRLMRPSLYEFIPTRELFLVIAQRTLSMLESGQLHPKIQKMYSMDEAAQAHEQIESGGTIGKLLISTSC